MQTHPIKHETSLTPPKTHIDQTLPFRMQLWHRCHQPTMPNNSSPSGYGLHINSCEKTWEIAQTHQIKHTPSLAPPKVHINQTLPFQMRLRRRCNSPTMPNNSSPSGYCLHINSRENCLRTCEDSSNQARAFPHTYILRYTLIKHCWFECDCSAAAIHQQCQTIPYHQVIASTSILVEIARELVKIHPIKHEPSLPPPKTHINQTLPFWLQLRSCCHLPTTPNNSSPSGYGLHINSCKNLSRTCADTSNQAHAYPRTS